MHDAKNKTKEMMIPELLLRVRELWSQHHLPELEWQGHCFHLLAYPYHDRELNQCKKPNHPPNERSMNEPPL